MAGRVCDRATVWVANRDTRGADAVIAALAGRQHGVVSRRQLLRGRRECGARSNGASKEGGCTRSSGRVCRGASSAEPARPVDGRGARRGPGRRAESPVRRRALGHPPDRARAASRSRLPTGSAARPGLHPHSAVLPPDEMTTYQGIPVTTAPRTLLDLAAVLKPNELDRALNEAEIHRLAGPQAMLERYERRRGTATLRTLLLNARRSHRSPTEAEFLAFIRAHGLPEPADQRHHRGLRVRRRLARRPPHRRLDGYATHGTRRAFEQDRARDRQLAVRGWRTLRVTNRSSRPPSSAAELLSSLRA